MRNKWGRSPFLLPLLALVGCEDALDQRLAIVDSPRVLAVIAEPAEARPGAMVTYRAILAGPDGPIATNANASIMMPTNPASANTSIAMTTHPASANASIAMPTHPASANASIAMATHPASANASIAMPTNPTSARSATGSLLADDPIALSWAYCTTPKAPTEDNAVSTGCVDGDELVPLATGTDPMSAIGVLPMDGCLLFGPDVPPGGYRPRDADPSGGFYQPVRVDTAGVAPLAVGLSRITCNLANATPDAFREYFLEYVANKNPVLDVPTIDGVAIDLAVTTRVARDADVTLGVSWPAESVEGYLYYDRARQALVDRRESLRVSFFATGGTFPVDSIAIDEPGAGDVAITSPSITWHTPALASGEAIYAWIVLRDARGGTAVQRVDLAIE